jgi:hypothetical protein
VSAVSNIPFGGTDCALPMAWAVEHKAKVDVFVVYTDSETWFGKIHPMQALAQYREKMAIRAKLIVVGMTSSGFSIADPDDAGALDVVGFDSAVPSVMADFVRTSRFGSAGRPRLAEPKRMFMTRRTPPYAIHGFQSGPFERTSKRRNGFASESRVKRGQRVVHSDKELLEKLGRTDPCPCGSGRRFQAVLLARWSV